MAKVKTNEQALKAFIKNADDISLALLRATIVSNAENILKNKEQVIADGKNSFISGELTVHYAEQVMEHLGFQK